MRCRICHTGATSTMLVLSFITSINFREMRLNGENAYPFS